MLSMTKSKEVTNGRLVIKDFGAKAVSEMLKFCYTGDLAKDKDVSELIEVRALVIKVVMLTIIFKCSCDQIVHTKGTLRLIEF